MAKVARAEKARSPDPATAPPMPPAWVGREPYLTLWHGTAYDCVAGILTQVELRYGQRRTDFGRGFYTTTFRDQAVDWACHITNGRRYRSRNFTLMAALVWFRVPLAELASLVTLPFVRPDPDSEAFWSFVRHCRSFPESVPTDPFPETVHTHNCPPPRVDRCYDMVCGPVAANWTRLRRVYEGYDQYSFHTAAGAAVLNAVRNRVPGIDIGVIRFNPRSLDVL